MLTRKLAIVLLTWGIVGITNAAFAQGSAEQEKPEKTLLDRLDDFRKSILGEWSSSDKAKDPEPPKAEPRPSPRTPSALPTQTPAASKPENPRGTFFAGKEPPLSVDTAGPRRIASQAMIETKELKLLLQLECPQEVLYGKKETYHLKLINTGNRNAENVAILFKTVGTGENVSATHKIGMLTVGGERVLNVDVTARQAGNLTIQVEAQADGGRTALSQKVLVRHAGLQADVDGPRVQLIGATATYVVRIRNPGTAPARNVNISVALPAGAKYVSGIEGARLDVSANRLEWTVESIGPELEHTAAIKCSLATPGANRVQVYAIAADDLGASVETVTQVESVANLMMDVKNPESPVPVGEEVTYEVRLRNGTKEARDVAVFAYLSNGIEPTAAEGGPNRLSPGQVVFQPIKSLAPGIEVVLKVRARAVVGGNHIFWAEADCKPLGARLVSEVTNLYYANVSTTGQPTTRSLGSDAMAADDPVRTANRPVPSEKMQAPPRQ